MDYSVCIDALFPRQDPRDSIPVSYTHLIFANCLGVSHATIFYSVCLNDRKNICR